MIKYFYIFIDIEQTMKTIKQGRSRFISCVPVSDLSLASWLDAVLISTMPKAALLDPPRFGPLLPFVDT